jgi:antitoxin component HigA of HigAB toxin-antitoxin module
MILIGTTKLLAYIEKFPDTRIPLMVFLKEFNDRPNFVRKNHQIESDTSFYVDGLDCVITGKINYALQTAIISSLNTQQEIISLNTIQNEQSYGGVYNQQVTRTFSVAITAPKPFSEVEAPQTDETDSSNIYSVDNLIRENNRDPKFNIHSEEDYMLSLNKVNVLFKAKPQSPEFEELSMLIPRIIYYEQGIAKPKLETFELVKHKMDLFSMTPGNLSHIVEEDKLNSFLEGKITIQQEELKPLFRMLAIKY